VPRGNSFVDDDLDTFPLHVRLAFDVDLTWQAEGKCRNYDGELRVAWSILPKEEITFGSSTYLGAHLIAIALEYCRVCPVQYDCARYAVQTAPSHTYIWGTWGASMNDLRWLKRQGSTAIVDDAETHGVPVQVALREARRVRRVA
jgi:Transcription factor WhiB